MAIYPGNIRIDTCPRPEYSEQERKQNHQGTVKLRFLLGADGTVRRTLVETSSGYTALDGAARLALTGCRFDPPLIDGKSVEGWAAMQYSFQKPTSGYSNFLPLLTVLPLFFLAFHLLWSHRARRSSRPARLLH